MMDFYSLPALTVLSDCVTIAQYQGIKVIRVHHEQARAAIALHGAHILSFQPQGQADLIWMSEECIYDGQAALRGGIPLCWPWFGKLGEPGHGFARINQWTLLEHRENEHGVIISLGLQPNQDTLTLWPHQFSAQLNIEIGRKMKVTLDVTNTDTTAWTFTGALHTYFNIGDINQVSINGMGECYIDKLQAGKACLGNENLTINTGVDRIYTQPQDVITINDVVHQRIIAVENQGDNAAVIWNPWTQAANMTDMSADGYQTMVCVESTIHADTLEQGQAVQPGQSYQLSTEFGIQE